MDPVTKRPSDEVLREFIGDNETLVYNFCLCLAGDQALAESLVHIIFQKYNKVLAKKLKRSPDYDLKLARLDLFKGAVSEFLVAQDANLDWHKNGRDTRALKYLQMDPKDSKFTGDEEDFFLSMQYRFMLVDADYRLVLVLKDLLGFTDDEVTQILELRWGVYRHRLHRGRMELLKVMGVSAAASNAIGGLSKPRTGMEVLRD